MNGCRKSGSFLGSEDLNNQRSTSQSYTKPPDRRRRFASCDEWNCNSVGKRIVKQMALFTKFECRKQSRHQQLAKSDVEYTGSCCIVIGI